MRPTRFLPAALTCLLYAVAPDVRAETTVKEDLAAAAAAMQRAKAAMDAGDAAKAMQAQQEALSRMLLAKTKLKEPEQSEKQEKSEEKDDKKKDDAKSEDLATSLDKLSAAEADLAGRLPSPSAGSDERTEWTGYTDLLDRLCTAAASDGQVPENLQAELRELQRHTRDALAKLADGTPRAQSHAALLAVAQETHRVAVALRVNHDRKLAEEMKKAAESLKQAADKLEQGKDQKQNGKPGDKPGDKPDGKPGDKPTDQQNQKGPQGAPQSGSPQSGGTPSGGAQEGKPGEESAREDAANAAKEAKDLLDAVAKNQRQDLNELRRMLKEAEAAKKLGDLAKEISDAKTGEKDKANAKALRDLAAKFAQGGETLRQNELQRLAKALQALQKADDAKKPGPGDKPGGEGEGEGEPGGQGKGKPSDKKNEPQKSDSPPGPGAGDGEPTPGRRKAMQEAADALADTKDEDISATGRKWLNRLGDKPSNEDIWPTAEEVAALRALLTEKIRRLRAEELAHIQDAPLPPEFEGVSEAYLKALSDDLDGGDDDNPTDRKPNSPTGAPQP